MNNYFAILVICIISVLIFVSMQKKEHFHNVYNDLSEIRKTVDEKKQELPSSSHSKIHQYDNEHGHGHAHTHPNIARGIRATTLPALSATRSEVAESIAASAGVSPTKCLTAEEKDELKESVTEKREQMKKHYFPDLSKYILKTAIKPCKKCPDMTNYIRKSRIPSCPPCEKQKPCPDLSNYILKTEIPQCPKPVDIASVRLNVRKEILNELGVENVDDLDKLREVKEEIKKCVKRSVADHAISTSPMYSYRDYSNDIGVKNNVNKLNCRPARPSYVEIDKNTSFLPDTARLSGNADIVSKFRAFQDFS